MNWIDESTEPVYANWSAGEPVYKDDQNDCAYFSVNSGTWNTKNCDERLHFVCEKGKSLSSKELTNKEASTVLCSVVKHAGSGRAREKCRGKHETQSSACFFICLMIKNSIISTSIR